MADNTESLLHDIDTRVRLVEADIARIIGTRKLIMGMAGFLIIQAIGGAIAYGQLLNKVDNLSLGNLERDVGVALTVIADHGTELQDIRNEQSRIRGQLDSFNSRMDEKTKDRYYRSDALRLEDRVGRLESYMLEHRASHGNNVVR